MKERAKLTTQSIETASHKVACRPLLSPLGAGIRKVRKHGYSNAGENWDAVVYEDESARRARRPAFKGGPQAWLDAMNSSMKLLSVGAKRSNS